MNRTMRALNVLFIFLEFRPSHSTRLADKLIVLPNSHSRNCAVAPISPLPHEMKNGHMVAVLFVVVVVTALCAITWL
jgi:hypothetical protein